MNYSIYLIKQGWGIDQVFDPEVEAEHFPLRNFPLEGILCVARQRHSTPDWIDLIAPYIEHRPEGYSAGISAVLLVHCEGRLFALTFGHGKSLLQPASWVRDFGLKVTLNRVDPEKLRGFDTRVYDDTVLTKRNQASRESDLSAFELDISRELIRGVIGDTRDRTFFRRLGGSDVLKVVTELEFVDLGDILDELLVAYADVAYQVRFPWVDNVREVDPAIADELDTRLVEALRARDVQGMQLAPTEVIDWTQDDLLYYPRQPAGRICLDFDIALYCEFQRNFLRTVTVDRLKAQKIQARAAHAEAIRHEWSVYDCIIWETQLRGQTYAILDGRWFSINAGYATRVQSEVQRLTRNALPLLEAYIGEFEADYILRVVNHENNRDNLIVMDRALFHPEMGATPIEFCDILSIDRLFIHIKRKAFSSSLSHLFAQGSVSGELLIRDSSLRREVSQWLRDQSHPNHAQLIGDDRPVPAQFTVVYVVITNHSDDWPRPLPFFSQVNLMFHAGRLEALGFHVCLQQVRARPR